MQVSRLILLACLGFLLTGLVSPATTMACGAPPPECCSAAKDKPADDKHASSPCPFKQADVCCTACPLTFAAIAAEVTPFVLEGGTSSAFDLLQSVLVTRSDRPPYPPPRC